MNLQPLAISIASKGKGPLFLNQKSLNQLKFSDIELHSLDKEKVKVVSIEEAQEPEILEELGLPKMVLIIASNECDILRISLSLCISLICQNVWSRNLLVKTYLNTPVSTRE